MTPPNFALCFTCLLVANMAQTASLQHSSLQLKSANVGGRVTLPCLCQDDLTMMFYWYKQTLGQKPNPVSTFYKHNNNGTFEGEFKNNPRFSLDTGIYKNHLMISNLQISDSATYYCVKRSLYNFEFCEGTTVNVKDSSSTIQALVHPSVSETIQPGDSVTLNCTVQTGTCDGEHSVYWFKDSEESHPGIIYTHGDRNDQCERKPDTQTQTCVYNLPMNNVQQHAGTYYCAVASCGHILLGDGNTVDFENNAGSFDLVYFLSGALAFTSTLVVLLAFSAYTMYKRKCPCTDVSPPNTELCQDEKNLHYATLRNQKINRGTRRQRDDTWSECVYSGVKQ